MSRVEEAWSRCLEVWKRRGRAEDFPAGVRMPRYTPDEGKRLALDFAERFETDYGFLLSRLREEPVEALCAFDVLMLVFERFESQFHSEGEPVPAALTSAGERIPSQALKDIRSEQDYAGYSGDRVGDFLRFRLAK